MKKFLEKEKEIRKYYKTHGFMPPIDLNHQSEFSCTSGFVPSINLDKVVTEGLAVYESDEEFDEGSEYLHFTKRIRLSQEERVNKLQCNYCLYFYFINIHCLTCHTVYCMNCTKTQKHNLCECIQKVLDKKK